MPSSLASSTWIGMICTLVPRVESAIMPATWVPWPLPSSELPPLCIPVPATIRPDRASWELVTPVSITATVTALPRCPSDIRPIKSSALIRSAPQDKWPELAALKLVAEKLSHAVTMESASTLVTPAMALIFSKAALACSACSNCRIQYPSSSSKYWEAPMALAMEAPNLVWTISRLVEKSCPPEPPGFTGE